MGTDLTVVNAARVSFKKQSDWEIPTNPQHGGKVFEERRLSDRDTKLVQYLAKHKHELPFAHPHVTLHVKAPIFVARQLAKHQVGFVWSEVSRRYVEDENEYYEPDEWRGRAENKKQGSAGTAEWPFSLLDFYETCGSVYSSLLEHGVAPEMARIVLPQAAVTEWYWTGSLLGWARVHRLRAAEDAQKETQEIAKQIGDIMAGLFPVSWKVLNDN